MLGLQPASAALPALKIKAIRVYQPPRINPTSNQSNLVVTVETDAGITGIGEGGSPDMLRQCAGMLIGEDPLRTGYLWELQTRAFYPPGREKLHAQGALDVALWDIKAKAMNAPLHQVLGGVSREYLECYAASAPGGAQPGSPDPRAPIADRVQSVMSAGFRCYRAVMAVGSAGTPFNAHATVRQTVEACEQVKLALKPGQDWLIDTPATLGLADASRFCQLLAPLAPFYVEDPLRSEALEIYKTLRQRAKVPLAVGGHFGTRSDISPLLERHLIDYARCTVPNVGGLTEWLKIAALCEAHNIGMAPHNTGPISTAALAHVCATFSGPVILEQPGPPGDLAHLPRSFDFKDGKVWPNDRAGIGVEFDPKRAQLIAEITMPSRPAPLPSRPDGSWTNW
jgi:L-alanine-DL-glutamate epimerase-like enolase superfamily enzyme